MTSSEVLAITYARANLPSLIEELAHGQTPLIGAHRKPQAALVPPSTLEMMPLLLEGFAVGTAAQILAKRPERGQILQPGEPAGTVILWLWKVGQKDALATLVADLIAQLRYHHPDAPTPRLAFYNLLDGIALSAPPDPKTRNVDRDMGAIVEWLRERVPRQFADDIDGK